MYLILWEFTVRPEHAARFERTYGANGDWATLFARGDGYRGTELLRDRETAGRYLTIDRWSTREAYDAFRRKWEAEYEALDATCGALTVDEVRLGEFEVS
ncbi:MAG: antibiotic biosynthesis monooxygenase family protein [Acidimicrobiales bacterium]